MQLFITVNLSVKQHFSYSNLCCSDFDGSSGQLLSDLQRLEKALKHKVPSGHELAGEIRLIYSVSQSYWCLFTTFLTLEIFIATKLSRYVITASWNGIISILSAPVDCVGQVRPLYTIILAVTRNAGKNGQSTQGIAYSIQGLQELANLCNMLGKSLLQLQ